MTIFKVVNDDKLQIIVLINYWVWCPQKKCPKNGNEMQIFMLCLVGCVQTSLARSSSKETTNYKAP